MLISTDKTSTLLRNLFGYGTHPEDPSDAGNKIALGKAGKCWLGVFTTDPIASGFFTEPSADKNYARVNIWDLMKTTFGSGTGQVPDVSDYTYPSTAAEDRRIGNYKDINFNCAYPVEDPTAASGGAWGDIKGFGLYTTDDLTVTTPYAWGKLLETVTVGHKNTLHFLKGRFVVYMDDAANVAAAAIASVE